MKRALTLSLAAALALPLFAEEAKKAEPNQAAAAPAATATTAVESPLVQAAKRSKKRRAANPVVITNETLKTSKGHVSTAHTERPLLKVPEPQPGPEQKLAQSKAKAASDAKAKQATRTDEQRKMDAEREKTRAAAAMLAEEGLYETLEGDEATAEGTAEQATKPAKPPRE